jgi:flavorubredoxin
MGQATSSIRKFINELGKLNLQGKQVAVFDTYQGGDFEKAVKKMEKQVGDKAPGMKLVAPGLSIMVKGMKGPIADRDLSKCQAFGAKIATMMKG